MDLTEKLRSSYAPGVPYYVDSGDLTLVDILFGPSERYPDRPAIDFMSRQTTYASLAQQVRQAATVLTEAGVREGDRVALVMPNCPQHIVALFAVSLLGGVVVEHNPLAPQKELKEQFDRHGAEVVVAWNNSVEKLDFLPKSATVFAVDLAEALPAKTRMLLRIPLPSIQKRRKLLGTKVPSHAYSWDEAVKSAQPWMGDSKAKLDEPAILLHTGGTTGSPKAVVLTHRNIAANVVQSVAWVEPLHEGAEVFYSVLPYFHAYGLTVTLLAGLQLGATIAVFPKFDVPQILLAQRRLPATFFVGVPPMFERLLKEVDAFDSDLSTIRFTLSGAMPLTQELSDRWEAETGSQIVEGYGMTEASPLILGSPLSGDRKAGALGLPWPSTKIRIVDPEDPSVDVEEGEVGELLASGPQVFSGYLNDDEETAEVLRDGWLHTGDLVQVRDGFIYMADRRKELIISGGFNIYPSQVEEAVRSMPGVLEVAVVGMPGGNRGEEVVAALVLEAGASVTLAGVREWAEKSIAHYALPRQIVVVQELPRSQIGKVLRRRVAQQLSDLQEGLEQHFPTLTSSVSEVVEKAGQATSTVKEALSSAASDAGEAASELLRRAGETEDES